MPGRLSMFTAILASALVGACLGELEPDVGPLQQPPCDDEDSAPGVDVSYADDLAGTIFTPSKVHHPCPNCGLTRHDPDAVHCKHCGETLKIETKGA